MSWITCDLVLSCVKKQEVTTCHARNQRNKLWLKLCRDVESRLATLGEAVQSGLVKYIFDLISFGIKLMIDKCNGLYICTSNVLADIVNNSRLLPLPITLGFD